MKTISSRQFKACCMELINEVQATRQPVLITKKGQPVAKLVPVGSRGKPKKFLGALKGKMQIAGDILSPVVPWDDWEVLR
jgi:prevent-host-death family protein